MILNLTGISLICLLSLILLPASNARKTKSEVKTKKVRSKGYKKTRKMPVGKRRYTGGPMATSRQRHNTRVLMPLPINYFRKAKTSTATDSLSKINKGAKQYFDREVVESGKRVFRKSRGFNCREKMVSGLAESRSKASARKGSIKNEMSSAKAWCGSGKLSRKSARRITCKTVRKCRTHGDCRPAACRCGAGRCFIPGSDGSSGGAVRGGETGAAAACRVSTFTWSCRANARYRCCQ